MKNKVKPLLYTYFPMVTIVVMFIALSSCNGDGDTSSPELEIGAVTVLEGDEGSQKATINITSSQPVESPVEIIFSTSDGSAKAGKDYTPLSNASLMIPAGSTGGTIEVEVIGDEIMEFKEEFEINIENSDAFQINTHNVSIFIKDNDDQKYIIQRDEDGYITPDNYPEMKLVWSDEFDGPGISADNWTFEIGDGCPDICGWGNNELETYTDSEQNARIVDGKLVITAIKETGEDVYTSARMISKDKKEFQFGRIDFRARLPEGQGIWPALWMLGSNIDEEGWPSCGEIDIMELVGHQPRISHGTAHYSVNGWASQGGSYTISENFSNEFHVFSIFWDEDIIRWYVDYNKFFELELADVGRTYPFNNSFFFIMNIAVGGNWPGSPDETTVFPQEMYVDYVRVFQPE